MEDVLTTEIIDNEICLIKLNRPKTLNSLNRNLVETIISSIDECESNNDIRSIILTGNGRGFCAGADLKERQKMDEARSSGLLERIGDFYWGRNAVGTFCND